ncbi:SDR family oxidoreductase [Glaciibacter psychrotolerans]|uniref:NAD(P)-dependent dehydrogenase (Short-subunit alcohol dehydrogenase family) n=1 Tax=Glaciibacter psychrotolerans TaxID=670054 RepID=A0A7Z0EFB4_9MICO|nr:SDR family oxidoreductase [Leifsonia psychrotolerans]NYJ20473.1 NAD(P)-dependent dehydrogenase (short-subunit alcohol dehydrogenase family) [Leifsonia psychrotolerans]
MSVSIDLSGKVVMVTGGGRGVGRGIVSRFLEAGATIEICGRTEPEDLPEGVTFRALDVRDPERIEEWVADVLARHSRIDIVVNNAGGSPFGRYEAGSPRYLRAVTDLNFLSAAFLCRAAYPALRESRGSIVNITSISARRPSPGTAIYGAAKAALESLTTSLATEWAPHVRVNAVSCGLVATEAARSHYGDAEQYARVAATIPRGQLAEPTEIGDACLMLVSPLAAHITGAILPVDGGGEWPAFLAHTPNADAILRATTIEGVTP